ncbi:uncharacterized protein FYW61_014185 [Anableps anableps]
MLSCSDPLRQYFVESPSAAIPGRHRKSAASINRFSSGFETSHIPPHENPPVSPSTSTLQTKAPLPSTQPSLRRQKNYFVPLNSGKVIARSHSCTDLGRNPAPFPLQRCVSLKALQTDQERKPPNPQDRDLTTTKSDQRSANPPPVCKASDPDKNIAFTSKQEGKTESRPVEFQEAPEKLSQPDSYRDFFLTESTCRHDCTDRTSVADKKSRSVSAASEARRLKMKRNTKISTHSVNQESNV